MKKLLYILFHRSVFVGLSLIAQVVALMLMVGFFSEHTTGLYWFFIALSVAAALLIVGSRMEPAYKIAWLLLVLPFPVFGGIFYLLVGGGQIPQRTSRRMKRIAEQSEENLREDFKKADDLLTLGEDAAGQARYLEDFAHCPAYTNTETEYFPVGDLVFPRMLEELRKAERYIFLEYFIIQRSISSSSPASSGTACWRSWRRRPPRGWRCASSTTTWAACSPSPGTITSRWPPGVSSAGCSTALCR